MKYNVHPVWVLQHVQEAYESHEMEKEKTEVGRGEESEHFTETTSNPLALLGSETTLKTIDKKNLT